MNEQESTHPPTPDPISEVKYWLEEVVIGWNLCPFARREFVDGRVRYSLSRATDEEQLLRDLISEIDLLDRDDNVETTLLIHPEVLNDFLDYNQFLDYADGLLMQLQRDGIYQVASFHPDYRFEGTGVDDQENYTNRSPYPLLHILREESLAKAIERHPDTEGIPSRNIDFMKALETDTLRSAFKWRFPD